MNSTVSDEGFNLSFRANESQLQCCRHHNHHRCHYHHLHHYRGRSRFFLFPTTQISNFRDMLKLHLATIWNNTWTSCMCITEYIVCTRQYPFSQYEGHLFPFRETSNPSDGWLNWTVYTLDRLEDFKVQKGVWGVVDKSGHEKLHWTVGGHRVCTKGGRTPPQSTIKYHQGSETWGWLEASEPLVAETTLLATGVKYGCSTVVLPECVIYSIVQFLLNNEWSSYVVRFCGAHLPNSLWLRVEAIQ